MTKEQIAAMIQDILNANTTLSRTKYDRRDISILISRAYNDAVTDNLQMKYRGKIFLNSIIDGGFITSYEDVPILYNENRNIYYSELPVSILPLERDVGIRQISPMEDESTSFINSAVGDKFVQGPLEVSKYPKNPTFQRENDEVYYHADELPWYFKREGATVLMKLVRDISDIPDDEEFNIPGGYETKIIDWVFEKLGISSVVVPDNRSDANVQNN